MAAVIRVLVVDDHPVVREGLRIIVNAEPDIRVVAEASSAPMAIEVFRRERPDVVLMDLRLGNSLAGFDAITGIRAIARKAHVVILTNSDCDEDLQLALRRQVTGFVYKTSPAAEMLRAIRGAMLGETHFPSGENAADGGRRLSERERDVLEVMGTAGRTSQIAKKLGIAEATVRVHVKRILKKLKVHSRTEAATVAIRERIICND
ncbi:MAG TPA: response regulator transcription factor [Thermoanaerobaculia bacterium]|nr:response regulator transcription factor [Thermoanaerobaculia bacterium]